RSGRRVADLGRHAEAPMGDGARLVVPRTEWRFAMTTAQWHRVRALFEEALDRPDARGWINGVASDDPDVAAEALSLFDHHTRAGAFLTRPIADRVADLLDEDTHIEPGSVIGSYTVSREIGRGGTGRVYQATDTRLKRQVALKVLRSSLT